MTKFTEAIATIIYKICADLKGKGQLNANGFAVNQAIVCSTQNYELPYLDFKACLKSVQHLLKLKISVKDVFEASNRSTDKKCSPKSPTNLKLRAINAISTSKMIVDVVLSH